MSNIQEAGRLGHSDHSMVLAVVSTNGVANGQQRPQPDWSKADWQAMREDLSRVDWRREMDREGACKSWETLKGQGAGSGGQVCATKEKKEPKSANMAVQRDSERHKEEKAALGKAKNGEGAEELRRWRRRSETK